MAGSGTRCQRWIAPTTAEYRPGSAIYGTEHCRSRATLVVGSIPVTDGALSILRAGLGNVRESFAILRSASSENDSAATPERDRPNRSAIVRSPAPVIRFPGLGSPPTSAGAKYKLGMGLSFGVLGKRRSPSNHSHC
jgi:hypothetical protein